MPRIKTDLCILGAGSAGLSLAAGAAQMGADVTLLEGGEMGGDCLNTGCVPSKALIAAGKAAQAMRSSRRFGMTPVDPEIDFAGANEHLRSVIARIAPHDSQERFEGLGVRVIRAFGRFSSATIVQAGDTEIEARRFVIATGSSPFVPPIPGLADVPFLTNETVFNLRDAPEHLVIIGGGPVGLEMAQAHARLGSRVTVVEAMQALGREDPELATVVLDRLRAEGVEIQENTEAREVRTLQDVITVETSSGTITGSHLLVAVGRSPNIASLDLDTAGIDHDRRGVTVDQSLRTSNRKVYAIGDVAGQMQFTHVAGYQAGVVARSILLGLPSRARQDHIPRATYTEPELAQIGLTEAEARKAHGAALEVFRLPFSGNDRAIATGTAEGLLKLMAVKGRPVGVGIAGPEAGELIGTWAFIMGNKLKLKALTATVLPYPTLSEINKRAAGAYFSPRLFDNPWIKKAVQLIQRHIP
jgi:pyruvate/2-oxoglutarate dehydrogenase complex dihydrolipoamide dehydrogenase (E3) component